ncbi:hypothetical protein JOM56_008382 [Amanita muscaria]
MSYANINDPNAVSALLDQLKASKAWKDVLDSHPPQQQPEPTTTAAATAESVPSSVAALLSQLQSVDSDAQLSSSAPPTEVRIEEPIPTHQERRDLKGYTFQQALPVIATLSNDPAFIIQLQKLKSAQDDLERRLWEERRDIQRKHEEKVKSAMTKASMIGVGISKHEADMINNVYRKELEKFDVGRALPAFDSLVAKQQAALAELNVPTMYVTDDKAAIEGQQRIIQVLGGLVETPYSEP